jgi:hypothetical protein
MLLTFRPKLCYCIDKIAMIAIVFLNIGLAMTIALMVYALAALILFLEKLNLTMIYKGKNNG